MAKTKTNEQKQEDKIEKVTENIGEDEIIEEVEVPMTSEDLQETPENIEPENIEPENKVDVIKESKKEYIVLIGFLGNKKNGEKVELTETEAKELLKEGYIKEVEV